MLVKHIDLVDRRLLKGEVIPHEEKIFSIFQDYTEFIKKGKLRPNVEIGKKVAITTDQFDLIVDYQIAENQSDSQMTRCIVTRNQAETQKEQQPKYRKLKRKHSAIESNINELENRGLGRCPDRSWKKFRNYTALAVCAYNLHKIGRKILKDRLAQEKKDKERLLKLVA